jgi:hypothetical protein
MFDRQRLLREVNNRIAEVGTEERPERAEFLCECGGDGCIATVTVPMEHYVQTAEAGFILAEGHVPVREDVAKATM